MRQGKKRANTRHPETQINDKFSFDSIDSGFDLCNYLADQYTAAIKKKNLSDRIKSNLDTAEKNLEMVLDSTRQSYMISARMKMFWKL